LVLENPKSENHVTLQNVTGFLLHLFCIFEMVTPRLYIVVWWIQTCSLKVLGWGLLVLLQVEKKRKCKAQEKGGHLRIRS
jgi:hypothetical protein